uniref:receptor-type tyrosine-protein phosphatase eta isoform X2 n=1 Tax=Myodes glareolus TaxID=447135 RepID=UPI00201FCAB5|nr:receptor-type tyrosine-protein phosphatase eta isoform X2 [Myodes glareolus]
MKPAALETRPPPRSPGLRWALLPLLLLLRLGQVLCTGAGAAPSPVFGIEAVSSPTSVELTWKHNDSAVSEYTYRIENKMEKNLTFTTDKNPTSYNITGLSPATSYTFSITPVAANQTFGDPTDKNVTTEPLPVTDLRVAFMGVTQALLTWSNTSGSASYRMLLKSFGNSPELTPYPSINISIYGLGAHSFCPFPESKETQNDLQVTEDTNGSERSPVANLSQLHRSFLDSVDPPSVQGPSLLEVLLTGLRPDTDYRAVVYSQAADGTEGQPGNEEVFTTNSSQVFDIRAVNISATNMTLTWKIKYNDGLSFPYTYKIHVAGETNSLNQTVNKTEAVIHGLSSSTLYNITVRPFLGHIEGTPGFLQVYTSPGPVSDFQVTNVSIREIGLTWRSKDSQSFRILTMQEGGEKIENYTTGNSFTIEKLKPGTTYHFEIFPRGPDGTEGPSRTVGVRTDRSAVIDIRVISVGTSEMQLEWGNTDGTSGYNYHIVLVSEHSPHETNKTTVSQKAVTLKGLTPGTLYNVTISPELEKVQGDSSSIAQYTRPSNVSDIEVSTNATVAVIWWKYLDPAPAKFSYCLILKAGDDSNVTKMVIHTGITSVTIADLIPGSSYEVEIFAKVGNVTASPGRRLFCMEPAPVAFFHCEMVPKEPFLVLKWPCPPGVNKGFKIGVRNDTWNYTALLENCTSENDTECKKKVPDLTFSTSYNISIVTLSCEKMALPTQSTCTTSITDPPPPDESPNITSVSHNSVKVKFSGFDASHGPIKAYAVILTTAEAGQPSADVLKYTYGDFKKGASDTYVTYLIRVEEKGRSLGLSDVLKYEINVGNQSTTFGYYNGRLEPLGSYRVCVAGFTNITYNLQNGGLINGNESYVSFSQYSDAVFLPQDPGVICGAVFGCILGALAIVAVGGFIFWRKKRKDAKNNEVSFSQIKSKLIRVENFEAYFKKQQADSNCGFAEEYEDLKLIGVSLPKYTAEVAENRGKNRYNNVLPYDISRVRLSVQTHSTDDYINANYVPGYHSKKDFIATQGPLPNTLKDFWRMVWEKNIYAIVMLTKCVEQGRTKCEEYWPSKQAQDYGDITVAMTSEVVLPEWTVRDFVVKNMQTSESHPMRQFHFTSWPDHGVPDTTDLLINFRYLVRDYMKQIPPESPILVHCSAGVGRTGTFIAIDRLIYQIENENTVDVYGIVYDLRMHRPLMVQTEDQYVFLNQCVLDIIRAQKDSKVDLIYQNTTAMTIYENLEPVSMFGKTNGYIA